MTQQRVLVTGGSGFIAGHCILQLLEHGYLVRTTVRSMKRKGEVRRALVEAGMTAGEALTFVAADLTEDAGWAEAVAGCDHVLHVASPVHLGRVPDEDAVIVPAREGTLRVLRAARDAGVRRVVLTSAFHAVGFSHPPGDRVFTEDDWSVLDGPGMDAYGRSKVLAERAAWDFVRSEGGSTELVTLLPVAVMGPVLGREVSGANRLVQQILAGDLPGFPNSYVPVVDVRDVAAAHVAALTAAGAEGQRILLAGNGPPLALAELGALLRDRLGDAAAKVPTRRIPDVAVRAAGLVSPRFRSAAAELGLRKQVSTERARRLLGFRPRSAEEAVLAAARSLVARSLVGA